MDRTTERQMAYKLALKGYSNTEISRRIKIPYPTVCRWAKLGGWREHKNDPAHKAKLRLNHLIEKSRKTNHDYKEMEKLTTIVLKFETTRDAALAD